jgi:enoyl-CoA hydratase
MKLSTILLENKDNIIVLSINRESSLNALNKDVFDDLDTFFNVGHLEYPNLKGVIITGVGTKAFAAGADIKEFMEYSVEEAQALSKRGHDVFKAIENFHAPVIAAVNGFALGGGCELTLCCHLRIAGEKAKFGLPEVNLGLVPGYAGTQRLHQIVGKAKALEMLMTTDMIGAEEAVRIGLANYAVPAGEELAKAILLIEKIATKGPKAVSKVIELTNIYYNHSEDGFEAEQRIFGTLFRQPESIEGINAFLEKRAPIFRKS